MAVPLLAGAAWLGGLAWFAATVPDDVVDANTPTDAIVVLTGGSERLNVGLSLLRRGLARELFVSGVPRGVDVAELLRSAGETPLTVGCCVVLGHSADSTSSNATETAEWMQSMGFHSMRLVTASYHMRRSLLEFRRVMPDLVIIPHPVFRENVKQSRWWLWPGTAHLIATEYLKFLAACLRDWAASTPAPA